MNISTYRLDLYPTFRDEMEIEREVARYDSECGPVTTYKMDASVLKQAPVLEVERNSLAFA